MSAYIKLSTLEYPRHEGDIRLEHPEIGEKFVCPPTYALVHPTAPPEFVAGDQVANELPPQLIDGQWFMTWQIHTYTQEEKDYIEMMCDPSKRPKPPSIPDEGESNVVLKI